MKAIALIFLLAPGVTAPLAAQGIEQQLVAARDTVWRAFFANDTALLRRYIPPAAASAEGASQMRWSSRADMMADARASAHQRKLVDLQFADTKVTTVGAAAIVQSSYQVVTETAGRRDTSRGRATELFMRQGPRWVNPYWQLEQTAAGWPREIVLPDTLGANFPLADSLKSAGTLSDYDALLGTWEFRFQPRRDEGGFWPPFTGHWTFEKKPGGGLIVDTWRPDNPDAPMQQSLYTYRTFDPVRKVWQMIGSQSKGGEIEPGLTWSDSTYRYAIQRNHGVLSRIRYLSIEKNSFLWRSDVSTDGGRTWQLDSGTMEARRISR